MLPNTYDSQNCSIARTLEVIGERWTPLILRDAILGARRFEDFHSSLGIARNVLSARLSRLVDEGILARRRYQDRPAREEYVLTDKGRALEPVLLALLTWGDRFAAPDGPPTLLMHEACGHRLEADLVCGHCGEPVQPGGVVFESGPGGGTPLAFRGPGAS